MRVEDGVDGGGRGDVAGSSSSGGGGGISRSSTLIGRRLAGSPSDFSSQVDREDSPLHSKRSSMCLTRSMGPRAENADEGYILLSSSQLNSHSWLTVFVLMLNSVFIVY